MSTLALHARENGWATQNTPNESICVAQRGGSDGSTLGADTAAAEGRCYLLEALQGTCAAVHCASHWYTFQARTRS